MLYRTQHMYRAGFSLIELLVVVIIIVVLSMIGLYTYQQFSMKERDQQRLMDVHQFANALEQYRTEFGYYPCGAMPGSCAMSETDPHQQDPSITPLRYYEVDYSWDWTDVGIPSGDDPKEVVGFLNGGNCCGFGAATPPASYPLPTNRNDDNAWGLYAHGFIDTPKLKDPLDYDSYLADIPSHAYAYASPADGRKEYALFTKLEENDLNKNDGGVCPDLYEIYSPGYDIHNGWHPCAESFRCDQNNWNLICWTP